MKPLIRFALDSSMYVARGSAIFYGWIIFLGFLSFLMLLGAYEQFTKGMIVTNYNDLVSWGLYEAQFVFLVGVAAAAVTVVFPSYVYHHKKMKEIVVLGELLAVSAVCMVMIFIMFHMGRPDRLWHLIPVIGIFNWPHSMLTWDVIVLNGYLGLNAVCAFYYLYMKYTGREVNKLFYMPLVYISIVWALSIHTVTAFLLNTMPARPMWFHSSLPIKFIATAFAAGPSMIILSFLVINKFTKLKIADEAIETLAQIVTWCLGITIFLGLSEVVTELYPSTEHSFSLQYLIFGKHGLTGLVVWYWSAVVLLLAAFFMLLTPSLRKNHKLWLPLACVFTFAGVWIDKGMGLVVPAFIPSPIGELSEYTPSAIEIVNTLGGWATGLLIFTVLAKGAIGVLLGEVKYRAATDLASEFSSEWQPVVHSSEEIRK